MPEFGGVGINFSFSNRNSYFLSKFRKLLGFLRFYVDRFLFKEYYEIWKPGFFSNNTGIYQFPLKRLGIIFWKRKPHNLFVSNGITYRSASILFYSSTLFENLLVVKNNIYGRYNIYSR